MVSNAVLETVPLDQIDERDLRYQISTGGPTGPLVASIERAGILTPPVLIPKTSGKWIIVSGFKRIAALKRLGLKETVARILDQQTDQRRCIEIAVMDNTVHRELNPVEQGRVMLLLDSVYSDAESLCQAAHGIGVPVNPGLSKKLRSTALMAPYLQEALIEGVVALPVALQLSEMKEPDATRQIIDLIAIMGLGLNRQRELLDWLKGIAGREGISLRELLKDAQVQQLIQEPDADRKLKSRLLRQYFRQRRYPEMVEAEKRLQASVKSLKLGNGIRLVPPQHFEGQVFNLTIEFRNHKELITRYQQLETPIHSSTMASLWDLFDES